MDVRVFRDTKLERTINVNVPSGFQVTAKTTSQPPFYLPTEEPEILTTLLFSGRDGKSKLVMLSVPEKGAAHQADVWYPKEKDSLPVYFGGLLLPAFKKAPLRGTLSLQIWGQVMLAVNVTDVVF